jgi:hypothetical protein
MYPDIYNVYKCFRHTRGGVQAKDAYMRCLADQQNSAEACTHLAKDYLQCRMDKCAPTLRLTSVRSSLLLWFAEDTLHTSNALSWRRFLLYACVLNVMHR